MTASGSLTTFYSFDECDFIWFTRQFSGLCNSITIVVVIIIAYNIRISI